MAAMPRSARATPGGYCYHVLNRGNGRRTVFHKNADYLAFLKLITSKWLVAMRGFKRSE